MEKGEHSHSRYLWSSWLPNGSFPVQKAWVLIF